VKKKMRIMLMDMTAWDLGPWLNTSPGSCMYRYETNGQIFLLIRRRETPVFEEGAIVAVFNVRDY
jgi:hypothetical protein